MYFNRLAVTFPLILGLACTLTACGGGGGTAPVPAAAPPVANAPVGVARGTITGFGSVFIGGKRFTTDAATFSKDGNAATENDFAVGMVVKVRGDLEAQRAERIEYEEDVKGPIDAIAGDRITVLGQVVVVGPETVVDFDIATANVGDLLEVSGFRNAADEIEATYIEQKSAVAEYEVLGNVRDLDTGARTFRVGTLVVDYSTARFDDFTVNDLANGLLVEVEDENRAYSPGDLRLIATEVELESNLRLEDRDDMRQSRNNEDAEIEGLVTEVIDANRFVIAGTTVRITAQTRFEFGTAADIRVGTKVEAEGTLGADDVLTAVEVEFKRNAVRIMGIVEDVDAGARRLNVLGVEMRLATGAELEDNRDDVENFDLSDLVAGDFVEARGTTAAFGLAVHELRRDESDDTRVRGPASDLDAAAGTLRVLGIAITTNASTRYERDDAPITRAAFFAALNDGQSLVDARWDGPVTDPTVPVRELELED